GALLTAGQMVPLKRAVLWRFQHCAYRCERLDQLLEGAHNLSSNNSCRAFAHLASMALVNTPYEGTEPTIRNSRSVYCALTAIVKGEWPYPLPVELRRFTFAARRSSKRLCILGLLGSLFCESCLWAAVLPKSGRPLHTLLLATK